MIWNWFQIIDQQKSQSNTKNKGDCINKINYNTKEYENMFK